MRYKFRKPFKVTPERFERMRELRASGKTYRVAGELVGVSQECARKWLTGKTPVRA